MPVVAGGTGVATGTTLAGLIQETKRHLQSFQREPMNKLGLAVDAAATVLTFEYPAEQIQAGSHLQVELELMYVWMVDASSRTAVVERAQLGSVAAIHLAGSVVTVNPKFPDFAIAKAINDDLLDLSTPANGLYAIRSVDLTATANSYGYDLAGASDLLEVLDVRMKHPGNPRQWQPLTNYELTRQTSAADFPSSLALMLSEGPRAGQPIRVLYKASFGKLVNLTDDTGLVAGLTVNLLDIPPMGAAVRMVAPREIKRNFTEAQGEPRRAAEVPPGAVGSSMRNLAAERVRRINGEAGRLAQNFPDRSALPLPMAEFW